MCSCGPPSPVFVQAPNGQSPFLDDLLGWKFADNIRSIFGSPLYDHSPYGMLCECGHSYLGASLSSTWALLVLLMAFAAGVISPFKRKVAYWMLGGGVIVSLTDTSIRVFDRLQRYPVDYREIMMARLPSQVLANALFQFALPFVLGVSIGFAARVLISLVSAGRTRFSDGR